MNNKTSNKIKIDTSLTEQGAQLTQAAEEVLARESVSTTGLSALSPLALLANAPSLLLLPTWSLSEPSLADHLEDAGLRPATATRLMRTLSRPGPIHETLAQRLAEAGASPVRLRELTASEAAEYLAGFLAETLSVKMLVSVR